MPRRGMLFYIYKYIYYSMILWWWSHEMAVFYTHIHLYIMILQWWDVMRTEWWLRSTMGSYGRLVIEVAYGKTLIHSTEAIWEILAQEEWLGCRHNASPIFDIPGSTSMWTQYIYFLDFKDIKTYMYYVFKSIRIIKKCLWTLTSSWPDEVQRMFSTAHEF